MSSEGMMKQRTNRLVAVMSMAALGIVVAGYLFFASQEKNITDQTENELLAVADLKAGQIEGWKQERLEYGAVILGNPLISDRIRVFMKNPHSPEIRNEVLRWLSSLSRAQNYKKIFLLGPEGRTVLSIEDEKGEAGIQGRRLAGEAIRSRTAVLSDFLRHEKTGSIHIDLAIPILIKDKSGTRGIAALLCETDPREFLYPLMWSWPTLRKTAESFLVRREGDFVLYLNELRFRKNTPLSFRLPLSTKGLLSAMALRGRRGVFEARDYRDVKVLAAVKSVPRSPWVLIAKIDADEVSAPIRSRALYVGTIVILLIGLGGASSRAWWRKESEKYYRISCEAQSERVALLERFEHLSRHANDIILQFDGGGNIVDANERALAAYGYSREELLGLNISDIRKSDAPGIVPPGLEGKEHNGIIFETEHRRKDGTTFPVEVSSRIINVGDREITLGIIRDIAERRDAERKIAHANRLYAVLSQINQIIVRIADRDSLFQEVCRIVADPGGFRLAWVGVVDREEDLVRPVCHSDIDKGCLENISLRPEDDPEGGCLTGRAAREGRFFVSNDISSDPRMLPWREEAAKKGYRSCGSFPLRIRGSVAAVLSVYSEEAAFFDTTEMRLLEEITDDISFALENIEKEAERKRFQEALRESEERLRAFFESDLIGTLFGDVHGNIRDANNEFLRIVGYTREDLQEGKLRWTDLTPPEFLQLDRHSIKEARSKGSCTPYEKQYIKKDGSRVWVLVGYILTGTKREDSVAFILDLTRRRMVEAALAESEAKYRTLVDNALVGVYKSKMDGRFLFANEAMARIFDFESPQELISAGVPALYERIEDRNAFLEVLRKRGSLNNYELELITKSRARRNVLISATLEGDILSGMILDVTEAKRLEERLRQAQKMEAIGQLAGGVSHDFNNILSAIMGYGELLAMKMDPENSLLPSVEQIISAARRGAEVTRRLLAFSRKQVFELHPVDLNEAIRNVEKLLARIIGEDIELRTVLRGELTVNADRNQLEQVLMNLAANARDAMPEGGFFTITSERVLMDTDFVKTHGYGRPGEYALISVADTGTGMSDETKGRIFEPFFTTKETGKGTGLGLAMAYGIIKQHNGFINVYSEEGEGTIFRIYLPAVQAKTEEPGWSLYLRPILRKGTETLLVAEDDMALRRLSTMVLSEFGYNVISARDGDDAVMKFGENREHIKLVILDMIMPKKNGMEAYEEITKMHPGIKALFVSGYTADVAQKKGFLRRGTDFLKKPFSPYELLAKVREILDRTESPETGDAGKQAGDG